MMMTSKRRRIWCLCGGAIFLLTSLSFFGFGLLTRLRVVVNTPHNYVVDNNHHQQEQEHRHNNDNDISIHSPSFLQDPFPLPPQSQDSLIIPNVVKLPYRVVHLDLKGAPPKLPYLRRLLPLLRAAGANALLLEYEDMFPYTGPLLANASHLKAYDPSELGSFLDSAVAQGFELIPLVQTFGHLEFILKLDTFKGMREVEIYPQEICPRKQDATEVVAEMLRQVVAFHKKHQKDLRYIHIGCDEVYHIGLCPRCRNTPVPRLFLERVRQVSDALWEEHRLRVIIWDDMLRRMSEEDFKAVPLGHHVELMIWDYTENVDHLISPFLWPLYTKVFSHIWAASAFKGAFGESLYKIEVKRHAENQLSWLAVLNRESPEIFNLQGIALTGWSRYDHFAVLCELLPASIPSLIMSLSILKEQNIASALNATTRLLHCSSSSWRHLSDFNPHLCNWEGEDLYTETINLYYNDVGWKTLRQEWGNGGKGWLTDWNVRTGQTSNWRLEELRQNVVMSKDAMETVKGRFEDLLPMYFEDDVVKEWMEQRVSWIMREMDDMLSKIYSLTTDTRVNTSTRVVSRVSVVSRGKVGNSNKIAVVASAPLGIREQGTIAAGNGTYPNSAQFVTSNRGSSFVMNVRSWKRRGEKNK